MPFTRLSSIDDPRLAPFRNLKRTNETRWQPWFVAEGAKLTERVLESGFEVVSLLFSESELARWADKKIDQHEVLVVPDDWPPQIVGFNFHRGVLACARRPLKLTLEDVAPPSSAQATLVICPDVQDPENLGGMLRTAHAFGVDAVIVGPDAADPFSRRVLRVSMGAALRVKTFESADLERDVRRLQQEFQIPMIATVTDRDAEPLNLLPPTPRVGLLFGSEGHGLDQRWIDLADRRVTIPMRTEIDSLNVGIAAAIFLYQIDATRRRTN